MDAPYVIFEDNHLLVVFKPAGFLSQPDGSDSPDILSFFKNRIKEKYHKPGNVYLGLVHRLDRNVSGVMVLAKTSKCASRLSDQIRRGEFHKRYEAVVEGHIEGRGRLVNYLVKDERINKAFIYDEAVPDSRYCELYYEVTGHEGGRSKVLIDLVTGRPHQIRAQFAHIGHPLAGDVKYGGSPDGGKLSLRSVSLSFRHPVSGKIMEFKA